MPETVVVARSLTPITATTIPVVSGNPGASKTLPDTFLENLENGKINRNPTTF